MAGLLGKPFDKLWTFDPFVGIKRMDTSPARRQIHALVFFFPAGPNPWPSVPLKRHARSASGPISTVRSVLPLVNDDGFVAKILAGALRQRANRLFSFRFW